MYNTIMSCNNCIHNRDDSTHDPCANCWNYSNWEIFFNYNDRERGI